jgi:hypothetical protein
MITKPQAKKIKALFTNYAKDIAAILEQKGIVNSIQTPYSADSIIKTVNGRENLVLEREILEICVTRKEEIKAQKEALKLLKNQF